MEAAPPPQQEQLSFLAKDREDGDKIFSVLDLINKLRANRIIEVGTTDNGVVEYYRIIVPLKKSQQPRNELIFRINNIFRRRQTTQWADAELIALRAATIIPDELELVEEYYKSEANVPGNYCRTSILTLLRHFPGEVDRARRWKARQAFKH